MGKVGGTFRALRLLHPPRVKKGACVGAAARLRGRTETEFGSHVHMPLRVLIGERMKDLMC